MSNEDVTKEIVDTVLAKQVVQNGELAQAAAVALRGVLPYAQGEVCSLEDAAKRDGEGSEALTEYRKGMTALDRADKVLRAIDKSHLPIEALKDDHFDNHINTYLDETPSEE